MQLRRIVIIAGGLHAPVSILISVYNVEEWVGASIDSLGQTWRQKKVIVVDDGSTDGTLAGARQFESNEVRVVTVEARGRRSPVFHHLVTRRIQMNCKMT
jgi:glycosyltransferase involved in cell wall biosynthesis